MIFAPESAVPSPPATPLTPTSLFVSAATVPPPVRNQAGHLLERSIYRFRTPRRTVRAVRARAEVVAARGVSGGIVGVVVAVAVVDEAGIVVVDAVATDPVSPALRQMFICKSS